MSLIRFTNHTAVVLLLVLALALAAFACGDDDDDDNNGGPTATTAAGNPTSPPGEGPTAPAGATVSVQDNFFDPDDLTVDAGTTVTWNFAGQLPHSVVGTYNGESISSDTFEGGSGRFEFTFDAAGTFEYVCGIHGASMSGTVTVN